jgi:hypothetical protein
MKSIRRMGRAMIVNHLIPARRWGIAIILAFLVPSARGALQLFKSQEEFQSALASFKVYTFDVEDGFPQEPVPFPNLENGKIQFIPYRDRTVRIVFGPYRNFDTQVLGGLADIQFANSQYAVGFTAVSQGESPPNVVIRGIGLQGETHFQFQFARVFPEFPHHFIGLISDHPLARIELDRDAPELGFHIGLVAIDNLTVGVVPEPAAYCLLALSGILLAGRRAFRRYAPGQID